MIAPGIAIAVVLSTLTCLLLVLKMLGRRLHPEIARKALHVGMGTICMSFPWIFRTTWPVVVLGILAASSLLALRTLPLLRASFGGALHGIERASLGEFYFIGGAVVLFCISFEKPPMFYVIPMLWLTFADATAALIGVRYATIRYDTFDGKKSLEGSTAFLVVTFTTTFIALVAAGHVDALRDGLIAGILGLLAMMLEAVAWNGSDNLIIPIFGYAFLATLMAAPASLLAADAFVLAALFAITRVQPDRTTLSFDALLAGILSAFTFFVLGGWTWLLAPVLLFLKDKYDSRARDEEHRHNVQAVIATTGVGLAIAVLSVRFPDQRWFFAYTASLGLQLAMFDLTLRANRSPRTMIRNVAASGLVAFIVVFAPYVLVAWKLATIMPLLAGLLAAPLAFIAAAAVFWRIQPHIHDCPRDGMRWLRQNSIAAAGAAALLSVGALG